jgi:pilus assembly protein CpaC
VHLEVKAVIDNIKPYRELGGGQYPVVTRRLAQTTIDIPDGETLVIAGLLDDQKKTLNTSIPGVSSLPIVGELFSGRSFESVTTDVVVLISPKVIKAKKKEALR